MGEEWSDRASFLEVVADFIRPELSVLASEVPDERTILEIGVGGGRVAAKVVEELATLASAGNPFSAVTTKMSLLDISSEMLKKSAINLEAPLAAAGDQVSVSYIHNTDSPNFPDSLCPKYDFIYSFDVFVHVDMHTVY